jgi:hypothetical protein
MFSCDPAAAAPLEPPALSGGGDLMGQQLLIPARSQASISYFSFVRGKRARGNARLARRRERSFAADRLSAQVFFE